MLTMKQLRKFVKTRAKSGFASNLQFQIDADACGFSVTDLGDVEKFKIDEFTGYRWCPRVKDTGTGWTTVQLVEFGNRLYLNGDTDADTVSMMSLMHKATWELPVTPTLPQRKKAALDAINEFVASETQ